MQIAEELSKNPPAHYLEMSKKPWDGGILNMNKAIQRYRELLPATFEDLPMDFAVGVYTRDGYEFNFLFIGRPQRCIGRNHSILPHVYAFICLFRGCFLRGCFHCIYLFVSGVFLLRLFVYLCVCLFVSRVFFLHLPHLHGTSATLHKQGLQHDVLWPLVCLFCPARNKVRTRCTIP